MRATPAVLVTGVAADAMAATTIALLWDLPDAVVVHHEIGVADHRLTRTVSDVTGVLERVDVDLAHACVSCAIREDVVPTLHRLAGSGRWGAVVAQLPVGAEARQVCQLVTQGQPDRQRPGRLRIAALVAAVDGARVVDDLLGDELLHERGGHTAPDDERGVAEVGAAQVEYADAVAVVGSASGTELALVRALARPDAMVAAGGEQLDVAPLLVTGHDHDAAEAWVDAVHHGTWGTPPAAPVWRLDLTSTRPFHPDRLYQSIERIGGGPRRSRGCFWLPSRPGTVCAWDGAGGQLSIGAVRGWGTARPVTRIVVTGLDDGRDEVAAAFEQCLLDDAEAARRGTRWEVSGDGFEAWLGAVRRTA